MRQANGMSQPGVIGARRVALVLGPSREAVSGVATHVNVLFDSPLQGRYELSHFAVGSEGRRESAPARLWRLAASPFALAWAIVRRDADLVHLNTSLNAKAYWRDLAYLLVARACGARVLVQKHGGSVGQLSRGNALLARFIGATLNLADAVAVLSRADLAELGRFVAEAKLVLAPNGIDCGPFRRYNRPLADPQAPLRLLYLGRLGAGKGLAESLEAMAALRAAGERVELRVVGSGPEAARLRLRAAELGLDGTVSFPGPAFGEEKARLLSIADVLLLPSHSEGLPYALLEAMAAGVVPVATPVGGIPDVMEEGVHGLFVPVGDASAIAATVARLSRERALLARMSAACRARVASAYSAERLAADFSTLYARLFAARAPKAAL